MPQAALSSTPRGRETGPEQSRHDHCWKHMPTCVRKIDADVQDEDVGQKHARQNEDAADEVAGHSFDERQGLVAQP